MGSGAVGVEFASIFRRFGSEVTIIELLPRLVPVEDEAVSAELEKSFRKQGIKVLHRHEGDEREGRCKRRRPRGADRRRQDARRCSAENLLVATGRGPVTNGPGRGGSGLAAGARLHQGRRAVPHRRPGHLRDRRRDHVRQARAPAARASVVGRRDRRSPSGLRASSSRPINYDQVPGCTYCDPEIGSVGLTEAEAKERGYDVVIGTFPVRRPRTRARWPARPRAS